jgi:Putative mono-oxygenase ydhR
MTVILQINFKNDVTEEELEAGTNLDGARQIAEFPGLLWKVWIRNPETKLTGGIYLFESRKQPEARVAGPTMPAIPKSPKVCQFSAQIFEVRDEPSRITQAPLDVLAGAARA